LWFVVVVVGDQDELSEGLDEAERVCLEVAVATVERQLTPGALVGVLAVDTGGVVLAVVGFAGAGKGVLTTELNRLWDARVSAQMQVDLEDIAHTRRVVHDLASKVKNWLKPDGRLFVTDYTW